MDFPLIFFSFTEAILTLGVGLAAALLALFVIVRFFLHKNGLAEIRSGNAAVGILSLSVIFATVWLTRSAVAPSLDGFRQVVLSSGVYRFDLLKMSLFYFLAFSLGAMTFSFLLVFLTLRLFTFLTRAIDEQKEILGRNLAAALVLAGVLITLSLSLEPAMGKFFASWVNYEKFEKALGQPPQARPMPGPKAND